MFSFSGARSFSLPDAKLGIAHGPVNHDGQYPSVSARIEKFALLRTGIYDALFRLGIPVLAGLVFVLALGWLSWWLLAWPLIGAALGCLCGRAVAIVNGRAGR